MVAWVWLQIWSWLLQLATPLYVLKLWRRGRDEPGYRQHLGERFGFYESAQAAPWVWVHAVSLGETRASEALIKALRQSMPGMRLLLTHGTATGRQAGQALLQPGDQQLWLPYDTLSATARFLKAWQPAVGVLMETELWPSLSRAAQAQGLPLVMANARLSDKSLKQGLRLHALLGPAVSRITAVLAQTPADAERMRRMGAGHVEVMGNLKFDVQPEPQLLEQGRRWRQRVDRPVLLAASFREGEEDLLLKAWAQQAPKDWRLLIVPRHPQRFDEVHELCIRAGHAVMRRSQFSGDPDNWAVPDGAIVLGDSLGEMPLYYAMADLALMGGTFMPLGGQNLIEAAACGCPVILGPSTFNFAGASQEAVRAGVAQSVADLPQALSAVEAMGQAPQRLAQAKAACAQFAAPFQGAADRMAARIVALYQAKVSGR